jgi:hypothetical protein
MNSTLMLFRGSPFAEQAPRRFEKDVLRVGSWFHPVTGQEVEVTAERLRLLAKRTIEYAAANNGRIPFQDGHTFDSMKTLGWWTGFRVDGDRLVGVVEVTDDEAARKIEQGSIRGVSVRIDADIKDTRGNVYPEVITHVAATPVPVVDDQGDFVQLSRGSGAEVLLSACTRGPDAAAAAEQSLRRVLGREPARRGVRGAAEMSAVDSLRRVLPTSLAAVPQYTPIGRAIAEAMGALTASEHERHVRDHESKQPVHPESTRQTVFDLEEQLRRECQAAAKVLVGEAQGSAQEAAEKVLALVEKLRAKISALEAARRQVQV